MVRKKENKKLIQIKVTPQSYDLLVALLLYHGYTYNRDGEILPAWSEFGEAIAQEELIISKKFSLLPLDKPL